MRRTQWATYLWPGLAALWWRGSWSGLALSLGAAALLDTLLLATLVWTEWFDARLVRMGWIGAAVLWITAAIYAIRNGASHFEANSDGDLFRQAQREYLQGDYFQAEATLSQLLSLNPRDAESRLLRATLLRRTERLDEAEQELASLHKLETSAPWNIEIVTERARIKQLRKINKDQLSRQASASSPANALTDALQLPSNTQAA